MIRSRPGFATQIIDDSKPHVTPAAAVKPDMVPAIAQHTSAKAAEPNSPLVQNENKAQTKFADMLQAKADAAHKKLLAEAGVLGPEILPSSAPSLPPITKNQDFNP